jgi:Citrate transporter
VSVSLLAHSILCEPCLWTQPFPSSRLGTTDAGLFGAVYFGTALISAFVTNNAAATLMFPIAMGAAQGAGVDLKLMCYAVMLGASDFTTPFGYQTNLMVYGPGGYKVRLLRDSSVLCCCVPITNIATVHFHDPITDDRLHQVWIPSAGSPLAGQYMGAVRDINGVVCELDNYFHHSGRCGCGSVDQWSRAPEAQDRCWSES